MKLVYDTKSYMDGRTTVMGFAAILIVWFHSGIIVKPGTWLELFKLVGDIGVDLFLFASGVGIYFAVNKYCSFGAFFSGRVRRVLIPYLCVCIPWYLYGENVFQGYRHFLKRILLLDFWIDGDLSSWYIAAILLLYVVTPFYIRFWKRYPWIHGVSIAAVVASCVFLRDLSFIRPWAIFLFRIPVYLLGLYFGKAAWEKKKWNISLPVNISIFLVGIICILSCLGRLPLHIPWVYKYLAYAPVAVGLSMILARLPSNPLINYFGTRSLEIYLIFEKVRDVLASMPQMELFVGSTAIVFTVIILGITLICVEFLRLACRLLEKLFARRG